jgi:signal transduction histidine kinase
MADLLFNSYYFTVFGVMVMLLSIAAILFVIYYRQRVKWQQRMDELRKALEDERKNKLETHLPLAAIHDLPSILRKIAERSKATLKDLDPSQIHVRELQQKIINQAYNQVQRTDNIKNLLKHGQEGSDPILLKIQKLIFSSINELFDFAENNGIQFKTDLLDLEPVLLNHDYTSFALTNVIHNAIKNSFKGGIVRVQLRLSEDETSNPEKGKFIWITVEDNGKGILTEDQPKIFDLGNSLGLYLARELCRLQGGDLILVRSEENHGSVFRIILPYICP